MIQHLCRRGPVWAALVIVLAMPVAAQQGPSLAVVGDVQHPLALASADLAAMPRNSVSTSSNGMQRQYEGVWLSDILKKAGVPLGSELRGAALAGYVLVSASDGYQVVFSLGELDPEMTDGQFLLADKLNGKALFGEDGAFRLVVPRDKRGARSVRMLTKIEVFQLRK